MVYIFCVRYHNTTYNIRVYVFAFVYFSEQQVELQLGDKLSGQATVTGVDENGFLTVKMADGREECVWDDGNSFDMMKNLILRKERN